MTVRDLRLLLTDVPDDLPVVVEGDWGFTSACIAESGEATLEDDRRVLVVLPCRCHEGPIEVELRAEDFGELGEN